MLRVRAIPQWCVIDVSFHPGRVPEAPIEHCSSTACPEVRAACGRDRVAAAWGRLAPRACCSRRRHAQSALRGAVGACWLSSGCPSCGVQSASTRARGPASPRSPPLITALRLVRGLVRTTMSGLGVRQVAKGRSERAPPRAFGQRELASVARATHAAHLNCVCVLPGHVQRGGVPRGATTEVLGSYTVLSAEESISSWDQSRIIHQFQA